MSESQAPDWAPAALCPGTSYGRACQRPWSHEGPHEFKARGFQPPDEADSLDAYLVEALEAVPEELRPDPMVELRKARDAIMLAEQLRGANELRLRQALDVANERGCGLLVFFTPGDVEVQAEAHPLVPEGQAYVLHGSLTLELPEEFRL